MLLGDVYSPMIISFHLTSRLISLALTIVGGGGGVLYTFYTIHKKAKSVVKKVQSVV